MTEKRPRNGFLLFLDKALKLVDGLKGIIIMLAAFSVGGAGGTIVAGGGDTTRVDSLEVRVDSLEIGLGRMQQNQIEMFSAQIERDTTLRAILVERAANRRKAADARADTQNLFNAITGGIP